MAVGDVFKKRRNLVQSAAPSVNIWNSGRMQRSPAPMTYADPSSDPNIGMYDLARGIDALREQSQIRFPSNPMSPTFGVVNPDVESARRLAPLLAQDAARQQNTPMNGNTAYYNNPMRLTPDQTLDIAGRSAQRYMQGGATADPTNFGSRFGGEYGAGLNADATAIQGGRAVRLADGTVSYFKGTQESARQAQLAGKSDREVMRDRSNMNVPQAELDRRDAADVARRERQAKHNAFKEANGGMNYRQYDRMQSSNALTMKAVDEGRLSPESAMFRMQARADKALRRAGNPMAMSTANGGRLFPDLLGDRGNIQNPAVQNPMITGGRTLEAQQAAAARIQERETASPNVAGLGVEPGSGLAGLNQGLSSRIKEDPTAEFSDDSLREFQAQAKDYSSLATDTNDPFSFGSGEYGPDAGVESQQSALWKELAGLPDNARSRAEWLQKYKNVKPLVQPDMLDPANQQPSPFQSPEKPMHRGGNPIYTPRLPIRTGA